MTTVVEHTKSETVPTVQSGFDPFSLMDRMDDELIRKELEGIASEELVYSITDKTGKEIQGLSKVGVDEGCNVLAKRGEVIREVDLQHELIKVNGDDVALFKATAARYAVNAEGQEVKLDQVIGTKIQPLWFEPAQEMSIDSTVPWGKHKGKTWRAMVENERGYLEWMVENAKEEHMCVFCQALLDGEAAMVKPEPTYNRFWFEQGSQKALRNARFRLIPAAVRAEIIALAKASGKVRTAANGQSAEPQGEQRTANSPYQIPFGNQKGEPLADCSTEHLQSMLDWCRKHNAFTAHAAVMVQLLAERSANTDEPGEENGDEPSFPEE